VILLPSICFGGRTKEKDRNEGGEDVFICATSHTVLPSMEGERYGVIVTGCRVVGEQWHTCPFYFLVSFFFPFSPGNKKSDAKHETRKKGNMERGGVL